MEHWRLKAKQLLCKHEWTLIFSEVVPSLQKSPEIYHRYTKLYYACHKCDKGIWVK